MKVVIVNGKPGAGKTTFETMCLGLGKAKCYICSSIDYIKDIARTCGWDGEKSPENRKFLSDLKDLLTTWNDIPMKKIHERIEYIQAAFSDNEDLLDDVIIFVDVREPNEIQRIKDYYGAATLLVTRDEADRIPSNNHADNDVYNFEYDIIIENNGSLDDLYKSAETVLNWLLKN